MVARFDEQKDHESVMHALAGLQHIAWTIELIGDGPTQQPIRQLAIQLGIADRVLFSGACNDVPQRLANADIFILMSHWEGFPLSILEAMRAQLPVIASSVGGVSEAVDHGKTGLLVPRGDVVRLRKAIAYLMTKPEQRDTMGRNGRIRFKERFTYRTMLARTIETYEQIRKLKNNDERAQL